jgi:hypothetical protein
MNEVRVSGRSDYACGGPLGYRFWCCAHQHIKGEPLLSLLQIEICVVLGERYVRS